MEGEAGDNLQLPRVPARDKDAHLQLRLCRHFHGKNGLSLRAVVAPPSTLRHRPDCLLQGPPRRPEIPAPPLRRLPLLRLPLRQTPRSPVSASLSQHPPFSFLLLFHFWKILGYLESGR